MTIVSGETDFALHKGEIHMSSVNSKDISIQNKDLVKPTIEEVRKQELITVLASLIKNYALRKNN